MECRDVHAQEVTERYLLGQLGEAEAEAFEAHYFECDDCLRELEALREVRTQLAAERAHATRPSGRARVWHRRRWWLASAAAVGVLSTAAVIRWAGTQPSSVVPLSPDLATLVQIKAPPYEPIRLRGATDPARRSFAAAMVHYVRGDFTAAIPGLEQAAGLDPEAPDIVFFLGATCLLTDHTSEGIGWLDRAVALGDTPFLEEAHLLLAKAHALAGRFPEAEVHLGAVIGLNGRFLDEARGLQEALTGANDGDP